MREGEKENNGERKIKGFFEIISRNWLRLLWRLIHAKSLGQHSKLETERATVPVSRRLAGRIPVFGGQSVFFT